MTRGTRNIAWIESMCRVPEGKHVGQPVVLRAWQRRVIRGIYDTPTRQAIITFGRKNGKTALAAMLVLLHLCGVEARQNSQLCSTAMSRDQAAKLFSLAAKMARMSPDLKAYVVVRDSQKELYCPELGTLYEALSADADKNFGSSPVLAIHDELGQVRGPRSALYSAIETGMGAHDGPLSVVISTQAPSDADLLSVIIDDARSGKDPKRKLFMYSAPLDLDPFSNRALKAANPAFGDFLNPQEVRDTAESARRMPSMEAEFRNLTLNQRVSQISPLIPRAVWEACGGEVDRGAFYDSPVHVALDLSARNDLTALARVAMDDDGVWQAEVEFFAPEFGVRERAHRDRVPYDLWAKDGLLTLTPGASVDYAYVAHRLGQIADEMTVVAVAYDRWRMDVLKRELERIGLELPLVEFGQGFRGMAPAIDTLESVMLNGHLRHGGHAILANHAANAIATRDPAGNRKLDKAKSTGRIDGIVALTMALHVATAAQSNDEAGMDEWLREPAVA